MKAAGDGQVSPVYVFLGERPLTRPWITRLLDVLLPEEGRDFRLEVCDGEQITEGEVLERARTRPFFPGRKVVWLRETPFFQSRRTVAARWKRVRKLVEADETERARVLVAQLLRMLDLEPHDLVGLSGGRLAEVLSLPRGESTVWLSEFLEAYGEDLPHVVPAEAGEGDRLLAWLGEGVDSSETVLLLEAEEADRRGSFYRQVCRFGPVVDLTSTREKGGGSSNGARAFVRERLTAAEKGIELAAMDLLLSLVGEENRVALQTEVEKLVSLIGARSSVTLEDVERIVARHREEAIYEFTEALAARDLANALVSLRHLLAQDVHALAVLAAIAGFLRRLILIHAALEAGPGVDAVRGFSYQAFQQRVLPAMKETWGEPLPPAVKGVHPYALYKLSGRAGGFELDHLLHILSSLVDCDLALKGSQTSPDVVLEALVLRIVGGAPDG